MNYLDIIFMLILSGCTLAAIKRGFIESLFETFSSVISIIITSWFYPHVANFIKTKTKIYDRFLTLLKNNVKIPDFIKSHIKDFKLDEVGLAADLTNKIHLPKFLEKNILDSIMAQVNKILNLDGLIDYISKLGADKLFSILSMLITFILVSIALRIAENVLNIISFLPGIDITNKLAGGIVGLARGALSLWIICMFFSLFIENPKFKFLKDALYSSSLAIKFYDFNLPLMFLSQFARNILS